MADLSASNLRWIFAIIATTLLFLLVLVVYITPWPEMATTQTQQFKVSNHTDTSTSIETVAIPYTYEMFFEFSLTEFADDHDSVYIYIFKDEKPDISKDVVDETNLTLHEYLMERSFRQAELRYGSGAVKWDLAYRDLDTTVFHVMLYNEDDPADLHDNGDVVVDMEVSYEPTLPLVPLFFIIAFILVLPIAIIRLYVISQKKKELRVLLTLDFENLSDEDKMRLGIPLTPKPQMHAQPVQSTQGPPIQPGMR
ncbi:MAG: hypothetical protein ACMUHB_07685 [Thermoplasmatota archaeon]